MSSGSPWTRRQQRSHWCHWTLCKCPYTAFILLTHAFIRTQTSIYDVISHQCAILNIGLLSFLRQGGPGEKGEQGPSGAPGFQVWIHHLILFKQIRASFLWKSINSVPLLPFWVCQFWSSCLIFSGSAWTRWTWWRGWQARRQSK